jgi:hypothetical protein
VTICIKHILVYIYHKIRYSEIVAMRHVRIELLTLEMPRLSASGGGVIFIDRFKMGDNRDLCSNRSCITRVWLQ